MSSGGGVWWPPSVDGRTLRRTLRHARNPANFLPRVLAHWYSRAAFWRCYSGATCHTSRLPGDLTLKRSNRLVLLVGVFLAIVAFIGILLTLGGGGTSRRAHRPPTELPTVIATQDIPLGTAIRDDQVEVQVKPVTGRDADAFGDKSQVIGKIVRQPVTTGAAITADDPDGWPAGPDPRHPDSRPASAAMAVQVDQVTGVGTVIKTGDYVDMVVGFNVAVPFSRSTPATTSRSSQRPQRHERQAAPAGHAGHRARCCRRRPRPQAAPAAPASRPRRLAPR